MNAAHLLEQAFGNPETIGRTTRHVDVLPGIPLRLCNARRICAGALRHRAFAMIRLHPGP